MQASVQDHSRKRWSHAVVIGGSLAGLLASRVLSETFERVTLIERDHLPVGAQARKGLPQGRHVHILLVGGLRILRSLFPGFDEELAAEGAEPLDSANDLAWRGPAGWGIRFTSDLVVLGCSRHLLDCVVRRRIRALANVRILAETDVTGLLSSPDGRLVSGVRVRHKNAADAQGCNGEVRADLVIDASGRTSKAPGLLTDLGYEVPRETVVNASLGYATRVYRRSSEPPRAWRCVYLQATPPRSVRGGLLFPIEGDRWIVGLTGGCGDVPPTDEAGFAAFARSLPSPEIADTIAGAEPLSAITGYRATENRWRHYEQMPRRPEGFIVVGDAACTFNPVYGQGMTVAGLAALTLRDCLREQGLLADDEGFVGFARRFQSKLAAVNKGPWLLATGQDLRYPNAVGGRPGFVTRLMHSYLDRFIARATYDVGLRRHFLEVLHMTEPLGALIRPRVAARVLFASRRPSKAVFSLHKTRSAASMPFAGYSPPHILSQNHGGVTTVDETGHKGRSTHV